MTESFAAKDDLILQTRIDPLSTSWLIDKTRVILNNTDIGDFLTDETTLDSDPYLTMDDLSSDPVFINVQNMISSVFHVDARSAVLRIRIPKIYYSVHSLHAKPKKLNVDDPILNLDATAQIQGVDIGLNDGIQIDFMITNPKTKAMESYLTAFLDPATVQVPESLEPAEFDVSLEAVRDTAFHFNLKSFNLDSLPVYVANHLNDIITTDNKSHGPITSNQIRVNPVTIRLSSLSRSVEFEPFKPLIQKRMKNILGTIITQVGSALKTTIGPKILKTVFSKSLPTGLSINTDALYTRFDTALFSQPNRDQLSLGIAGTLCTLDLYAKYRDDCVNHVPAQPPVRILSDIDQQTARDELESKLAQAQADVVTSVSEEYLNRLLKTTIDAKLWDAMMQEDHLKLGPKGAFIILNKSNQAPELFIDVIYEGNKGITGILINPNHPIRFPLRISTKLGFQIEKGSPKILITTEKVLSTPEEIIRGIPEYDLPSHLVFGLKKKIASLILKMAKPLEGKNAIEMALPIFKGLGLEKTWYETSAYGRLNLYFKI